jgi:hypothetical protein
MQHMGSSALSLQASSPAFGPSSLASTSSVFSSSYASVSQFNTPASSLSSSTSALSAAIAASTEPSSSHSNQSSSSSSNRLSTDTVQSQLSQHSDGTVPSPISVIYNSMDRDAPASIIVEDSGSNISSSSTTGPNKGIASPKPRASGLVADDVSVRLLHSSSTSSSASASASSSPMRRPSSSRTGTGGTGGGGAPGYKEPLIQYEVGYDEPDDDGCCCCCRCC